jgi:hypothetical protein
MMVPDLGTKTNERDTEMAGNPPIVPGLGIVTLGCHSLAWESTWLYLETSTTCLWLQTQHRSFFRDVFGEEKMSVRSVSE